MAAGDVWDYIFGSYVNAARALPYINDGVIVIRRLNARGCRYEAATTLARPVKRKSGSMHALRVAHGDALWNTAGSHGISNGVDKIGRRGETTRLGCMCIAPSLRLGARQARRHYGPCTASGRWTRWDPSWIWEKRTRRHFNYKLSEGGAKFEKAAENPSSSSPFFSLGFLNISLSFITLKFEIREVGERFDISKR